jgi:cell division protein FtsB
MVKNDKKFKKFFNSCWFLLLMILIFGVFSVLFVRAFYQDYQIKKDIEKLKEETEMMESKKIKSLDLLNYMKSEEFVEKKARLEMNMVKPGENAGVVKEVQILEQNRQIINNMVELNLPNYKKWWDYFFKHN